MDRVGYGEAAPVPRIVIAVTHSADDSSRSSAHKQKKPRKNAGLKNGSGLIAPKARQPRKTLCLKETHRFVGKIARLAVLSSSPINSPLPLLSSSKEHVKSQSICVLFRFCRRNCGNGFPFAFLEVQQPRGVRLCLRQSIWSRQKRRARASQPSASVPVPSPNP